MGAQLGQGLCRRQPRVRERGAEGWVLLVVGFRQPPQGFGDLRILVFPEPMAAEGGWRAHTHHPRALLVQAQLHRLAAPPKDPFRMAGVTPAIFQRHRRLERAALRPRQLGTRQA